jgi:hypothetical protein
LPVPVGLPLAALPRLPPLQVQQIMQSVGEVKSEDPSTPQPTCDSQAVMSACSKAYEIILSFNGGGVTAPATPPPAATAAAAAYFGLPPSLLASKQAAETAAAVQAQQQQQQGQQQQQQQQQQPPGGAAVQATRLPAALPVVLPPMEAAHEAAARAAAAAAPNNPAAAAALYQQLLASQQQQLVAQFFEQQQQRQQQQQMSALAPFSLAGGPSPMQATLLSPGAKHSVLPQQQQPQPPIQPPPHGPSHHTNQHQQLSGMSLPDTATGAGTSAMAPGCSVPLLNMPGLPSSAAGMFPSGGVITGPASTAYAHPPHSST